jgi:hypothetical protein
MSRALFSAALIPLLFACSSKGGGAAPAADAGDPNALDGGADDSAADTTIVGYDGTTTLHGTIIDYFTMKGIPNLTVGAAGATTTTDTNGAYSFGIPGSAPAAVTVTGTSFSMLVFPEMVPQGPDVDFGPSVMASSNTFSIELSGLGASSSKGLVQIVVRTDPSCASATGGTVTVLSPPGTTTTYFASNGLPNNTVKSFQDVQSPRPEAVISDVDPGADLVLQIDHPTCTQVPFPYTREGRTYTGKVPISPALPGEYNSALVVRLQ